MANQKDYCLIGVCEQLSSSLKKQPKEMGLPLFQEFRLGELLQRAELKAQQWVMAGKQRIRLTIGFKAV